MTDINHVVLIGRLTRDAELKYTANAQSVSKFSIAVNRKKKSGDDWVEEVNFFDIVLWGRQGESLNQYLLKGKQVGVDGELRQDRWQDNSGQNRSKVEIIASSIQLLGGGDNNGGDGGDSGNHGGSSGRVNSGNGKSGSYSGRGRSNGAYRHGQGRARENDDGFTDDIPY
jgi:single-strand DNA-binding protein